jgi:alkaline phosphatase/streptomycin-6-phosphatase
MRLHAGVVALIAVALAGTLAAGIAVAASVGDKSGGVKQAVQTGKAKNVIFFLGDGMGESEITLGRYYAVGADGRFEGIDAPLLTGDVVTHSVSEADPSKPDYVPDSASTGTAWATGHKTSDNRVSTSAGTDQDLKTILEWAQENGYATGNVSTAEITDATPAVLDSHVRFRACQGPQNMATCPQDKKSAGGPGSVAEQTVQHGVDVVLGGGKARFDQIIPAGEGPYAGQTVIQQAQTLGYDVVGNRSDLLAYSGGKKLLGLFNAGNMTTEWNGTIAQPYPSNTAAPTGERCNESNRPANEPSLGEMTRKALELLDKAQGAKGNGHANGKPGFFLQVEGASIDKQDHAANPCAQIGETIAFDAAMQVGLEYASSHPDTLIVVTADHAHTSQILDGNEQTASDHAPGLIRKLRTADGADLVVSYGTNLPGRSQEHTGATVRVAAQGPQAAGVVGTIDQTELFHVLARAVGAE